MLLGFGVILDGIGFLAVCWWFVGLCVGLGFCICGLGFWLVVVRVGLGWFGVIFCLALGFPRILVVWVDLIVGFGMLLGGFG